MNDINQDLILHKKEEALNKQLLKMLENDQKNNNSISILQVAYPWQVYLFAGVVVGKRRK